MKVWTLQDIVQALIGDPNNPTGQGVDNFELWGDAVAADSTEPRIYEESDNGQTP